MSKKQSFGRYEVQRVLGRGGMGTVYLAADPVIDRTVAIKEIRVDEIDDISERTELEARFKLEYRSAGTLSHQNIVTIYDVVEDNGAYYIAMEYVEGMSLGQRLKQEPKPPFQVLCGLATQIASGLDYAHGRGIVHRDIKPANVLLTPDGHPKITDFGLAKWRTSELTMTGTVLGTPAFMSPEQVMGKAVDGKSDQFSFAIILYLMLTGDQPFFADHPSAILYKIVHEEPVLPCELNLFLPPAVNRTMQQALAKNPEHRFPSCSALAAELKTTLLDEQTTPLPHRTAPSMVDQSVTGSPGPSHPGPGSGPTQLSAGGEPTQRGTRGGATQQSPSDGPTQLSSGGGPTQQTIATPDEMMLTGATPAPRQRRRRSGAAMWFIGPLVILAIGALAYWASSMRKQAAPAPAVELETSTPPSPTTSPVIEHMLRVEAGPAGAVIRVNGEATQWTVPADVPLSGEQGETVTVELLVDNQTIGSHELALSPEPPAPWIEELVAPPLRLSVTSLPAGASIRVGGRDTGLITPADVELGRSGPDGPARHALEVTLAGYESASWNFTLDELSAEQRTNGLHFPLTSSAPPGFITVNAPYPVWLQIGGRRHGPFTGTGEVPVTAGSHRVVLLAEDVFLRQTSTVEIDSGERERLRVPKAVAVRITANPANCEVSVDGIELGATPIINRRMVTGWHEFLFYWPAEDVRRTVRKNVLREGQSISETHN